MRSHARTIKVPAPVWDAFCEARKTTLAGFPSDNATLVACCGKASAR
jgi:hypothetical protein